MVIAFHKPYGVLCQFTADQPGQRTLADFGFPPAVYPVGRLDMDSEGLLLLTDEPGFNHRFLDPKRGHPRTYLAQVEGIPEDDPLERLRRGDLETLLHRAAPRRAWSVIPTCSYLVASSLAFALRFTYRAFEPRPLRALIFIPVT